MTQKKLSRNYCPLTKNFYVILLQSQFRQSGMSVIFIGLRKLHWHFLKNARIQGTFQWFSAVLITLFVWCCDSCVARYWSKRESVSSMPVHSERKLGFLVGFTYDVVIELVSIYVTLFFTYLKDVSNICMGRWNAWTRAATHYVNGNLRPKHHWILACKPLVCFDTLLSPLYSAE